MAQTLIVFVPHLYSMAVLVQHSNSVFAMLFSEYVCVCVPQAHHCYWIPSMLSVALQVSC